MVYESDCLFVQETVQINVHICAFACCLLCTCVLYPPPHQSTVSLEMKKSSAALSGGVYFRVGNSLS